MIRHEENGCRLEGQRKEIWIYSQPAWLIAHRERMLEFYSIHQHTQALDVIQVNDSENCFQSSYCNTVPCMYETALSLSDKE